MVGSLPPCRSQDELNNSGVHQEPKWTLTLVVEMLMPHVTVPGLKAQV